MEHDDARDRGLALSMGDLHAGYGARIVLKGVDISVQYGEVVALLGGNGTGKSTVLKCIAGLVRPWKGEIRLFGQVTTNLPPNAIQRRGVGYLLQGGRVFPNLTVAENLHVPRPIDTQRRETTQSPSLVFAELAPLKRRRAGLLSGGQRQMLAVEMVLRQQPTVLLMDEPSAGLAPEVASRILTQVGDYAQRTCSAVLLVEQKARAAARIASRVLVLADGRASEDPGELALLLGDQGLMK